MSINWRALIDAAMDWYNKQDDGITPGPGPVNPPIDPPVIHPPTDPGHFEHIAVADLFFIPERMRLATFEGSDNALWYALAYVALFGPGEMPDDGAGSLVELSRRSPEIERWWDGEVDKVRLQMLANPMATATAIFNDGPDRCGFRLGPTIVERLREFGDRVQLGEIVPESEYRRI